MKKDLREKIWLKCDGYCAYCGIELAYKNMQVDHIHPKYRGGKDLTENYNPSCRSCNSTKDTYTIEEFRIRLIEDVDRMRRDSSKFRILERFGIIAQIKNELKFHYEIMK